MGEKAEATPGKWEIVSEGRDDFEVGVRVDDTGYYAIATVHDLDEETEPNAHMITASRDMYEVLGQADIVIEQALDAVDGETRERLLDLMDTMHAAIIKARGHSQ